MDAFSQMIGWAVNGGLLSAYSVRGRGGEGVKVSHLLFANDTLIFCKNSQVFTFLCWLLIWFKALLGFKINLEKSELIQIGRVDGVDGFGG